MWLKSLNKFYNSERSSSVNISILYLILSLDFCGMTKWVNIFFMLKWMTATLAPIETTSFWVAAGAKRKP
ncbi:hypothetical protein [Chryseobacterium arachidis]|uniref:hypothetical protein n=1 Tax=Chryseobacterium arachidis TaxID=1416778 RepID=UPI00116012AD|nr:hypothetical protein [Chryseobacterium arachidis]